MSVATATWSEVPHRGFITVSVMLSTIMQALDTSIANVALPHMQGSLSASQDQISWVLTCYIVAAAIATPLTGWVAGRYGRKRLFLVSIAGFTMASLLCGSAINLAQIVAYRLLQGVFGAALIPLSQAVLLDINPRERHAHAMAIWGAGIVVAPILGPTLGGWLTDTYDWRWVFLINLPVGILAFGGVLLFVIETPIDRSRPFDLFGFAMLSLGLGALQMMLDRGQQNDWWGSTETWVELMLSISGFWVFVVHSATADHPFVSLALFKDWNFVACSVLMFLIGALLYGTLALLPPLLQDLYNYPVVTTGNLLAPRGVGTLVAMAVVGRLSGRVDPRVLLVAGFSITGFSLWEMTQYTLDMDTWTIVAATVVQGLGFGLVWVPLSVVAFATLPNRYRTEGSAFSSLTRNIGGSLGISIGENVLVTAIQTSHASIATHATPYNLMLQLPNVRSAWDLQTLHGLTMLNAEITRQAEMIAYIDVFRLLMVLTFATMPLLLLLRIDKSGGPAPAAVLD